MELKFNNDFNSQKLIVNEKEDKVIQLELGSNLNSLSLKSVDNFKVFQQTQTSVTLMNEGPHIDLTKL